MTWCGNDNPEHRVRKCNDCQAAYKKARRRYPMPSVNLPRQRPRFRRTPLNDRVDALYAECQELGGCMAGRQFYSHGWDVRACVRCGVPVKARSFSWMDNSTMFRNGEAA